MTTLSVTSLPTTIETEGVGGVGWGLDTAFTLASIYDLQEERAEKTNIMLIDSWFPLQEIDSMTILGSFAWSSPASKRKWVHIKNARLDRVWSTPADRARDYLTVNKFHKQRRRVTTQQYEAVIARRRSHPLYAEPCVLEDAVYVDIKSAYWSILSLVGWDVDYNPGRWLGVRSSVSDFPFKDDKLARNSLVSVSLPGTMRVWTGSKLSFIQRRNPFVNMVLWSLIHDTLHGVASDVIKAGALYCFTDGFICPSDREGAVIDAISAWGLPAGVKERGKAVIRGVGDYDIGTHRSKRPRKYDRAFDNIEPVHKAWLRRRLFNWYLRSIP